MSSLSEQFYDALAEEGLEHAVVHVDDSTSNATDVYVQRPIGEEKLVYKTSLSPPHGEIDKSVAVEARNVAHEFEQKLIDQYNFNGRPVALSVYDGGWAECLICSTKVEVPTIGGLVADGGGLGECTTPSPVHRDREQTISRMDDKSRMVLRLYLIGLLRASCDRDCPNNRHSLDRKI